MPNTSYEKIKAKIAEFSLSVSISHILQWDANIIGFPKKAITGRGQQLKYLDGLQDKMLKDKELLELLESVDKKTLNNLDKRNLQLIRDLCEEKRIYPEELNKEIIDQSLKCHTDWVEAKAKNDFKIVQSSLEKMFELTLQKAEIRKNWLAKKYPENAVFKSKDGNYAALVDAYALELNFETIEEIFSSLKKELPGIREKILSKMNEQEKKFAATSDHLKLVPKGLKNEPKSVSIAKFGEAIKEIMLFMGMKEDTFRINTSVHPFCFNGLQDIKITHHFNTNNFLPGLYATIHETGHGLYNQGLPQDLFYQPVGEALGFATHESIAHLHEFCIGQSDYFVSKVHEIISKHFECDIQTIKNISIVLSDSRIRVDADMVNYPMHVMLRYEVERALFSGSLKIKDLPEFWRNKHKEIFSKEISSDSEGCLQDVHFYYGGFGYFPSYCLGLMMASQLYLAYGFDKVTNDDEFRKAEKKLCDNLLSQGSALKFDDLVKKNTGKSLGTESYLKLIKQRYNV